jgi:hypothetical protein
MPGLSAGSVRARYAACHAVNGKARSRRCVGLKPVPRNDQRPACPARSASPARRPGRCPPTRCAGRRRPQCQRRARPRLRTAPWPSTPRSLRPRPGWRASRARPAVPGRCAPIPSSALDLAAQLYGKPLPGGKKIRSLYLGVAFVVAVVLGRSGRGAAPGLTGAWPGPGSAGFVGGPADAGVAVGGGAARGGGSRGRGACLRPRPCRRGTGWPGRCGQRLACSGPCGGLVVEVGRGGARVRAAAAREAAAGRAARRRPRPGPAAAAGRRARRARGVRWLW